MEPKTAEIRRVVGEYVLSEFLPGEKPESLRGDTALISGGILDSIQITKLVIFLEETYRIEFQAHEIATAHIDTLDGIVRVIRTKLDEHV